MQAPKDAGNRTSSSLRTIGLFSLLLTTPCAVAGESPGDSGLYAGGAVGMSRDTGNYTFTGATVTSQDLSNPGAKVYIGFRFVRYFGIELGYAKLGATSFEGTDSAGGPLNERFTHDAMPLSIAGFLPLGDRWEVTGRLGAVINSSYNTGNTCFRRTRYGTISQTNCSTTPFAWGLGVRYRIGEKLGLRLDYDSYALQDAARAPRAQLNFISLGLDYRF